MNPFTNFSFERLRFEYERRERQVSQIKDEQRRKSDEYWEYINSPDCRNTDFVLKCANKDDEGFRKQIETLQQELNQIEEAMNV
jgi:hypothetical protein